MSKRILICFLALLLLLGAGCGASVQAEQTVLPEESAPEAGATLSSPPSPFPSPTVTRQSAAAIPQPVALTFAVDNEIALMIQCMADVYMQIYEYVHIAVDVGNPQIGIERCANGSVDMAVTMQAPTDVQASQLQSKVLCKDSVAVIVGVDNAVQDLSLDDVRKIYLGEITDWADLSEQSGTIHCYTLDPATGMHHAFEQALGIFVEAEECEICATSGYDPCLLGVQQDALGIGYTQPERVKYYDAVKTVSIEGVAPTQENVISGKYMLSSSVLLVTKGQPNDELAAFIDFCTSDDTAKLIMQNHAMVLAK